MIKKSLIFFAILFSAYAFAAFNDNSVANATEFFDYLPQPEIKNVNDVYSNEMNELECMVYNIYHESRGEGILGMEAVANVIYSRTLNPNRYGTGLCGVTLKNAAFSWTNDGKVDNINDLESIKKSFYISIKVLFMRSLLNKYYKFDGKDSTHYHKNTITPKWVDDKGMNYVFNYNRHIFYRWY